MKTEIKNGPCNWIDPEDAGCGLYIDSKGDPTLVGLKPYFGTEKYVVKFPNGEPCTYDVGEFPYKLRRVLTDEQIIITGE